MEPAQPKNTVERSRPEGRILQLSSSELAQFDGSRSADHLARLEGDIELVTQLALNGYRGHLWNRVATTLARYGLSVIGFWVRHGIFRHCAAKGLGALDHEDLTERDMRELAQETVNETVGKAVEGFRTNVLIPGVWRPAKGATLKTFFIGQCILQFPNIYRRWRTDFCTSRNVSQVAKRIDPEFLARPAPVDVAADLRRHLAELRKRPASDASIRALSDDGLGFTNAEIGELLRMTPGAVQARLYRARQKAKKPSRG